MELLPILRELQATLDYLRTVERDLSALPPDLAALDSRLKTIDKQVSDKTKALETARTQIQTKTKDLATAQKDEDRARIALKATSQKVQYTAAIRDLDEKERQKSQIARPLKALEIDVVNLETALAELEAEQTLLKGQFDELHAVFLEEHGNQVAARTLLRSKQAELEAKLPPPEKVRFHRLATARQGRAVVPVENGACTGCRVKLRGPFLFALKDAKDPVACESCQRILFLP
jgi:predicted  nucleic acid-binding Zn-ribbon protein